jgi:antitoxin (DNA-binding transcriptional repressor) of toxin-antitoxin stability system
VPIAAELTGDYDGHMVRVGVAELKAKLSAYLRRAQRGETILVLDRDAPVAKLTRYGEPMLEPLRFTPATTPFGSAPLGAPLPKMDVDGALAEERRDRV